MIDIHSHILPCLDDGASSLGEALLMARKACDDGIRVMVATPHCLNGIFAYKRPEIIRECKAFNEALAENGIPLHVLPGAEYRLCPELLAAVSNGQVQTLGDAGTHILVELPEPFIIHGVLGWFGVLLKKGITPVIAHPERNSFISKDVDIVWNLHSAGAQFQITAGSLGGDFGYKAKRSAEELIESGLAHFIGSDAHDATHRAPGLSFVRKRLYSLIGPREAEKMLDEHPQTILSANVCAA